MQKLTFWKCFIFKAMSKYTWYTRGLRKMLIQFIMNILANGEGDVLLRIVRYDPHIAMALLYRLHNEV